MAAKNPRDPRGKTVLVSDDDDNIRNLLEILIGSAGFKVVTASSGEEAISKLAGKPDALLLDLIMPGCGGLGVLKHLKTVPGPIPPVIVITAYENRHPTVVEAVMDPNVVQCLAKPMNHEVLIEALHRYLNTDPVVETAGPGQSIDPTIVGAVLGQSKLDENRFFNAFSPEGKKKLISMTKEVALADGDMLFKEGDKSDGIYLLRSGQIELFKTSPDGRAVVLATASPCDYFGEIVLLDKSGRNTGARAKGPATVDQLSADTVRQALEHESIDVTLSLMRRVLDYLRAIDERYLSEVLRKEKIQLIGEMASSIIHDFKNPLSGVQLAAQIIMREHQDAATLKACGTIQQQADRMVGMAQELLDFSRGSPSLRCEPMAVPRLFEIFRALNDEYLKKSSVRLTLKPLDAEVSVDLNRMLRVLQNLVSNSVDAFGPKGGEVVLSAAQADGTLELVVADDGPGIPFNIQDRVFEPFFTHGKKKGTGLGMAIAKTLVEAHGGRIKLESEEGKGTTIRIALPRKSS
jgi:signal transduction histidine kinase/CheY-like chemotaxis protein